MNKLKGVKWYVGLLIIGFSFYTYSQIIGMRWLWSTKTEPPSKDHPNGSRYFLHK